MRLCTLLINRFVFQVIWLMQMDAYYMLFLVQICNDKNENIKKMTFIIFFLADFDNYLLNLTNN